jgi:hypothetical protein
MPDGAYMLERNLLMSVMATSSIVSYPLAARLKPLLAARKQVHETRLNGQ